LLVSFWKTSVYAYYDVQYLTGQQMQYSATQHTDCTKLFFIFKIS